MEGSNSSICQLFAKQAGLLQVDIIATGARPTKNCYSFKMHIKIVCYLISFFSLPASFKLLFIIHSN